MCVVAAVLSAILSFAITKALKRAKGTGCVFFIVLTVALSFVLAFVLPKVVIIGNESNEFTHKSRYALFSYKGHHLSFGSIYMDNQTGDDLVVYPVWYGNNETETFDSEGNLIVIDAEPFMKISHEPDYYFYVPSTLYAKKTKKAKCKWAVEKLEVVLERAAAEKEKTKRTFESILP